MHEVGLAHFRYVKHLSIWFDKSSDISSIKLNISAKFKNTIQFRIQNRYVINELDVKENLIRDLLIFIWADISASNERR